MFYFTKIASDDKLKFYVYAASILGVKVNIIKYQNRLRVSVL